MSKRLALLSALALPLLYGAAGHAAPIGGTQPLTVAGVSFSNFGCTLTGGGMSSPGACSQISVGANPQGNGIEFSSGFSAVGNESFSDAVINYTAMDTAGITGVSLGFNGDFMGYAISSVTETIRDAATDKQIGFLTVSCSIAGCDQNDPGEGFIPLDGSYTDLLVQKDILVASDGRRSDATISIIDQGYQTNVPEPASMALLGAGLLGLGIARRRSRVVA